MKTLRNHVEIKSLVLGTLLGVLVMLCIAAAPSSNRKAWEYKIVVHSSVSVNTFHSEKSESYRLSADRETEAGWELFSVQLLNWSKDERFVDASLVFRREKAKRNPEK